jgi:hypothetical protein
MDIKKLKKLIEDNQQRTKPDEGQETAKDPADKKTEDDSVASKKAGKKETANPNKELPGIKGSTTMTGEKANNVDIEPGLYPKEIKEGRTAVVAFGRFNPPTVAHEQLIGLVEHFAKNACGTPMVFLSRSHDSKKNPMVYESKLGYARFAFGDIIKNTPVESNELIKLATDICEQGFNNLIFVAGSDRVAEFTRKLNRYNGELYEFDNIVVESAGERDADSDDVKSVSASRLRESAENSDFDEFKKLLAPKLRFYAEEIYAEVRGELNELNTQQRAKRAVIFRRNKTRIKVGRDRAMRRRAPSASLKKRSRRLAIKLMRKRILRSQNYNDLSYAQRSIIDARLKRRKRSIGKISRKLLPRVIRAEASRKIGGRFINPMAGRPNVTESMLSEMINFLPEAEYDYELSSKEIKSLQEKAREYETSYDILETCFRRGIAMWESIETDMTFSQYGFGRVNSFLNGGKAYDADFDLVIEDCEDYASTTDDEEDADGDGKIEQPERAVIDARAKEKVITTKPVDDSFHRHERNSVNHRTTDKPGATKRTILLKKIYEIARAAAQEDVPNADEGMGKRRVDIPQLTNFDAFHKDLVDSGHQLGHDYVEPNTLTPTQKHFNQEKVDKLKENGWGDKGIIISNDDYVIDGHHRWLAAHQMGEKIKARRASLDCDELLDFCKGKPYVEKKTLSESEKFTDEHGITWTDEGMGYDSHGNHYEHHRGVVRRVSSAYRAPFKKKSIASQKHYHIVPFAEKETAKSEGMRWDPNVKKWYHTDSQKSAKSAFKKHGVK